MKAIPVSRTAHAETDEDAANRIFWTLRHIFHLALFQLRLMFFWGYILLPVVAIGGALLLIREGYPASHQFFYGFFEWFIPLMSGFLLVPLVMREQEQRTLVLIGITQCSLARLFAFRLLLMTLFLTMLIAILAFTLQLSPPLPHRPGIFANPITERDLDVWPSDLLGGPHGFPAVWLTLLAPTLFLAGIGTALAHLTADVRVGYLAIFSVWMLNRIADVPLDKHPLLRYIFLFVRSGVRGEWLMPKLVQLALGIGLFLLSGLLLYRLEHFLREA